MGSGPNAGPSPAEWEDFPSVCSSIRLSIRLSVRSFPLLCHPGRPEVHPARSEASGFRLHICRAPKLPQTPQRAVSDWTWSFKETLLINVVIVVFADVGLTRQVSKGLGVAEFSGAFDFEVDDDWRLDRLVFERRHSANDVILKRKKTRVRTNTLAGNKGYVLAKSRNQ